MAHEHHHHHNHTSESRLFWTMLVLGLFVIIEFAGGLWAHSLTLIADAGHQLTDTGALALAWYAARAAHKPATADHSFGHQRIQVLAALINGGVLIALSVWIIIAAIMRFITPEQVGGTLMLVVACVGAGVNVIAFAILNGGQTDNLNVRGALLHVLGDLLGFVAAIIAAILIIWSGWIRADPALSIVFAGLILRSAWLLSRESWHILMQGRPAHLNPDDIRIAIPREVPQVANVHHVHAWSLTESKTMVTLHACVPASADQDQVLLKIQTYLEEHFDVSHSTIQIERGDCVDHVREPTASAASPS